MASKGSHARLLLEQAYASGELQRPEDTYLKVSVRVSSVWTTVAERCPLISDPNAARKDVTGAPVENLSSLLENVAALMAVPALDLGRRLENKVSPKPSASVDATTA
jgi:hypothetical protein